MKLRIIKVKKKIAIIFVIAIILVASLSYAVFLQKRKQNAINSTNEKKQTFSLLKIGFLTDLEYGTRKQLGNKLTRKAPVELAKAVLYLNQEFHPDLVVGGGDYIESSAVKSENAKEQLKEINEIFSLVKAPRLYALGNHDLRSLSKSEVREILGISENHEVKDIGDWRVVVLDTNFTADGQHRSAKNYVNGNVSQEELNWLRESLQTNRPVLVFSHHSPIDTKKRQTNESQNIFNAQEVRSVLEEAKNVVAVISGHTPTTYFERLNGINYFIADTLVNINALGSFATIEVGYNPEEKSAEIVFKQFEDETHEYQTEWKYGEKKEDYQSPMTEVDEFLETEE